MLLTTWQHLFCRFRGSDGLLGVKIQRPFSISYEKNTLLLSSQNLPGVAPDSVLTCFAYTYWCGNAGGGGKPVVGSKMCF